MREIRIQLTKFTDAFADDITACFLASVFFQAFSSFFSTGNLMKVLILAGGESAERSVSLAGGKAVHHAIGQLPEFESVLIDPSQQPWLNIASDVVFPVLHGTDGEDGSLQRVLEKNGQAFVGSGSAACELTFNKQACSKRLTQHGIACPAEVGVNFGQSADVWKDAFRQLKAAAPNSNQWVVKPNQQGSSVGIAVLDDTNSSFSEQLVSAIRNAFQFDQTCLIQQYIVGREITVSLLDGEVLSAIEISVPSGFYDFHAKYESLTTKYQIARDQTAKICCNQAKQINHDCHCEGIVRIDFRIDKTGHPWFLELNTIPGMSERSLVPKSAVERGWSLSELCRRAITNVLAD